MPDPPSEAADSAVRPVPAAHQIRSFGVIVATFLILLLIALAASWAAIDVVNSTRAYATGEGRYSKAQKIAVLHLHRYAYSGRPEDYAAFQAAIAVPLGDRTGRLALERQPADRVAATVGFLEGENHADDIPAIIRLFLWAGWWEPFAAAVADWREGDRLVGELIEQAALLNQRTVGGTVDAEQRRRLLDDIDGIDRRLTRLETTFTNHIGEAARGATWLVVLGLGLTTILLWTVGIAFATRLMRRQLALDRQLGSSEQRFRDYAEVASDWFWESAADHRIVYLSERFVAVTGVPAQRALQRDALALIREHADNDAQGEYLAAFAEHRPIRGLRLRFTHDDGSTSYMALSGRPIRDGKGRFLGYRGAGSDITAAVRDAQVLWDAKGRAEIASRAKSEFLANISHELRTPLNAILGFSEVIAKRVFGPHAIDRYAGYADDINTSGRHLLSIIDDVLDLSKVEAGHAELVESEVDLDALVGASLTLLGNRFEATGLTLSVDLPEPPPRLRVDSRKFNQILVNLLSNALKFTPRGGSVTLGAAFQTDGGLSLTVHDTGIGIAPNHVETALSPFGQVESAFSRKHHGTGLGLPLARSLIELHGGTLTLQSTLGTGTVVTLSLPARRVVAGRREAALVAGEIG